MAKKCANKLFSFSTRTWHRFTDMGRDTVTSTTPTEHC